MSAQYQKLYLYTDGGARNNPGPGGIGVLITADGGDELMRYKDYIGEATNNVAEYCALIAGLELAASFQPAEVACHLDSELVVRQLTGVYKVKDANMQKLFAEVKRGERAFRRVTYTHLPRTNPNMRIADSLVNQALDEELTA